MHNDHTPNRPPTLTWLLALGFGIVGVLAVLVGINLLGFLFFSQVPSYNSAQGLGTMLFYLSILLSPLGGIYWVVWGGLASTSKDDGPGILRSWAVFLGLLVGITGLIGLVF